MVRSLLTRKLLRDMGRARVQFVAVILLCALGTWVFSGLDAAWRMLDVSIETYYSEQQLADLWVKTSNADRAMVNAIRHMDNVTTAQTRFSAEMEVVTDSGDVTAMVHAYEGAAAINIPLVRSGEALNTADSKGCLIEEQFGTAQGWRLGDTVTLSLNGVERRFIIRGFVLSPEHVITARDVMPDPAHYGFVITNASAFSSYPQNEVLVETEIGMAQTVEARLEQLYPAALVISQRADSSTLRTRNDVTMFKNLSYVFPALAFAVAALIVLTTITRMVDDQRTQLGTLKALGYRDGQIRRHYLSYALYPSLVGSLLGLYVGRLTLPQILWNMETGKYILPYQLNAPVSELSWFMCGLSVALSCLMCLIAYRKSAREYTASLLRPKPPKSGSRILLERIPALWRHFSFNSKMVVRNLLRSKSRTFMTLVGIFCCNMLLITSFGLQDSIDYFVSQYYLGTLNYDVRADLTSDAGRLEAYQSRLNAERVEGIMEKTVNVRGENGAKISNLTILAETQQLLRLGKNSTAAPIPAEGVGITRKLADTLGVAAGDSITLQLPGDKKTLDFTIAQIYDVNVNQGVYLSREQWEPLGKGAFIPTALLVKNPGEGCVSALEGMDELDALKYPAQQYRQTLDVLETMMGVFTLMSGAALGLAFVISYNMGLLNFSERTREYATLKVLGYHQREIRRLILSESNLVTTAGVLLGVYPGILLTRAVMHSCESEEMVFAVSVSLKSILIASLITFVFSLLIQWQLARRVRSIDMVEALKSVE